MLWLNHSCVLRQFFGNINHCWPFSIFSIQYSILFNFPMSCKSILCSKMIKTSMLTLYSQHLCALVYSDCTGQKLEVDGWMFGWFHDCTYSKSTCGANKGSINTRLWWLFASMHWTIIDDGEQVWGIHSKSEEKNWRKIQNRTLTFRLYGMRGRIIGFLQLLRELVPLLCPETMTPKRFLAFAMMVIIIMIMMIMLKYNNLHCHHDYD